ncbi:MAG TPA: MFS transporter [Pseudomonas sp.]|nr:MFS transporter [Pseudomonas sp.]MAQ51794.1 MFS transporter [Pseudomonas sp.]MBB52454.1 MFS transporter [Pseudomonadales bacterium]HCA24397.1 MFS transporter [Pseudomonas sp.]|tara:strand:- start:3463 stop:3849 length:387 start_codon:yes stop_codon:yes gene_type:complete
MFNEAEYQSVWWVYLAAAGGCWLVWWKITALARWWFVREPLCLIMAVLLFTPMPVEQGGGWYAPAFLIYLLDTILSTGDNGPRALAEISITLSIAAVCWLVYAAIRVLVMRWWRRTHPADEQQAPAES